LKEEYQKEQLTRSLVISDHKFPSLSTAKENVLAREVLAYNWKIPMIV